MNWEDLGALDDAMKAFEAGIYHLPASDNAVAVLGSRKQAFVRGGKDLVQHVQSIMTGVAFQDKSLVVPLASSYSVTLSLLNEKDEKDEHFQGNDPIVLTLINRLSKYVDFRVSSQIRYFVPHSGSNIHFWSNDFISTPLERSIDLVLYHFHNHSVLPSYLIPGSAGVVYEYDVGVWVHQLKLLLGFPNVDTSKNNVKFAPAILPEWEEELWRQGVQKRFDEQARKTLASLPGLFDSIPGLPVTSEVSKRTPTTKKKSFF
jgi:hypothetical protein